MKLQDWAAVVGLVATMSVAAGGAGKYYMDNEYVNQKELRSYFIQRDIQTLNREARRIERVPTAERSADQAWELQDLENEISDLKEDLQHLKE